MELSWIIVLLFEKRGGPGWQVLLGRKDSLKASFDGANKYIPSPNSSLETLIANFHEQGLDVYDLVALSGQLLILLHGRYYWRLNTTLVRVFSIFVHFGHCSFKGFNLIHVSLNLVQFDFSTVTMFILVLVLFKRDYFNIYLKVFFNMNFWKKKIKGPNRSFLKIWGQNGHFENIWTKMNQNLKDENQNIIFFVLFN